MFLERAVLVNFKVNRMVFIDSIGFGFRSFGCEFRFCFKWFVILGKVIEIFGVSVFFYVLKGTFRCDCEYLGWVVV